MAFVHPENTHVALLKGGTSGEREVSLASAREVGKALREEGFNVTEIDTVNRDFIDELQKLEPDVAFICLHGRHGEDGTIQGLCELLDIRYTGSGVLSSALALDKAASKIFFNAYGLPTPPWMVVRRGDKPNIEEIIHKLGENVAVKPAREGSSLGVTLAYSPKDIAKAIQRALELDPLVIVEKTITGVETCVGVLGNESPSILPVLEIVPQHSFYDYESKYVKGMSEHIIPARISSTNLEKCRKLAAKAHLGLGCAGLSRSDFIVDDEECWLLETNTLPGMTSTSLLPDAAAAAGISFGRLCRMIVEYAYERFPARQS